MMGTRNKMLQTELKDAAYYRETNFPDVNTPLRDLPSSANNGAHSGSSGDYFGESSQASFEFSF